MQQAFRSAAVTSILDLELNLTQKWFDIIRNQIDYTRHNN